MKQYELPPGRSGRPRVAVSSHSDLAPLIGIAALVGIGWVASRWWSARQPAIVGAAAEGRPRDLRGLDAILRR